MLRLQLAEPLAGLQPLLHALLLLAARLFLLLAGGATLAADRTVVVGRAALTAA
jgi:hypothetical protein